MNLEDRSGVHHFIYDLPQGVLIDHLHLYQVDPSSPTKPSISHGIEVYVQENISLQTVLKLIDLEELVKS